VENGLDFLTHSLEDFKTSPKYSVIHFYAGVELLLKARLMAEHWSLVVSKRQDPDWERLQSGDFISVSLDEAAARLDKVVGSRLNNRELEAFRSQARHRNRMVHFFHEAGAKKTTEALLRDVAREQLVAWYLLNRLLTDRWADVFDKWKKDFAAFGKGLREHEQYLQITFDELKAEIDARSKSGISFRDCPSCGFAAFEIEEELGNLFGGACLVCTFRERCLSIECPGCHKNLVLLGEGLGTCDGCGKKLEPAEVADLIEADAPDTKAYLESGMPAHCALCGGFETVVAHGGKFLCASCFESYDDRDLKQCDWCSSLNAGGDMEDSFWAGCAACDGSSGWHADRDD